MRFALFALLFAAIGVVLVILTGREEPAGATKVSEDIFLEDFQGREMLSVSLFSYEPPRERARFDIWSGMQDRTDLPDPHISAFAINSATLELPDGNSASLLYQVLNINFEFSEELRQRLLVTSIDGNTSKYVIPNELFLSFDRSTRDFLLFLASTDEDWVFLGIEIDPDARFGKKITVFVAPRDVRDVSLPELSRVVKNEQYAFVESLFERGLVNEMNLHVLCEKNRAVLEEYLRGFLGDGAC